jgi:hypothetical protein
MKATLPIRFRAGPRGVASVNPSVRPQQIHPIAVESILKPKSLAPPQIKKYTPPIKNTTPNSEIRIAFREAFAGKIISVFVENLIPKLSL